MGNYATISGQTYYPEAGSLSIQSTIARRSTASFKLHAPDALHFRDYQQIAIYDASNTMTFSGYITSPSETPPGFQPTLDHSITCCDQHYLADKRRVTASFTNKTCAYVAYWLWQNILVQEGVTIGHIEDGPTPSPYLYPSPTLYPGGGIGLIPSIVFNLAKVSDALDALAKKASEAGTPYYWQIDYNKKLWFVPYTSVINSTIVDGTQVDDGQASGQASTVTRANALYRNTQYATGGVEQTVTQTETRIGDSNTTTWAMDFDLASAPTILVNSTAKNVGIKGTSGYDFYWQQGSPDISQDSGGTKLTNSDTLHVTYIGQYDSIFVDADNAQIALRAQLEGTSGIVEDVVDDQSITSATIGLSVVGQLLALYCRDAVILTFNTLQTGFAQGQLITVTLDRHGLYKAQMLIEDVSASDSQDGFNVWYTITAIQGPYDQNWVSFFQKITTSVTTGNITVGTTQAVSILGSFTATIAPTAALTATVIPLPVPSSTLYPSSILYPG